MHDRIHGVDNGPLPALKEKKEKQTKRKNQKKKMEQVNKRGTNILTLSLSKFIVVKAVCCRRCPN